MTTSESTNTRMGPVVSFSPLFRAAPHPRLWAASPPRSRRDLGLCGQAASAVRLLLDDLPHGFRQVSQARDIESFRLKGLQVRSKTSRLPVALDAEVEMMHPPLQYRSRPGALRVIVPQTRDLQKQPH